MSSHDHLPGHGVGQVCCIICRRTDVHSGLLEACWEQNCWNDICEFCEINAKKRSLPAHCCERCIEYYCSDCGGYHILAKDPDREYNCLLLFPWAGGREYSTEYWCELERRGRIGLPSRIHGRDAIADSISRLTLESPVSSDLDEEPPPTVRDVYDGYDLSDWSD